LLPVRARAENFAIPQDAWLHLDPDRRISLGRRALALDDYAPGPAFWDQAARRLVAGAIKLSPASDFAKHFTGRDREIELVSVNGECKEATVWFGELASCHRRATRLPENVTWTNRDGQSNEWVPPCPVSTYLYDPDPSLIRAGLLDSFAQAHELHRTAEGVAYLTGSHLVSTPFLAAFEVQEVSPLDLKRIKKMIARHEIGTLEIKTRGVDIAPEALRARLRLRGARAASLLLVGGRSPARAVLAQRASTGRSTTSSTADEPATCDATGAAGPLPPPSA
jgi:hypothetical protein